MSTKQTLLDNALIAQLLTMLMGAFIIIYIIAVSKMLHYSSTWSYDPARMLGWGAVALMSFCGMMGAAVAAIRKLRESNR